MNTQIQWDDELPVPKQTLSRFAGGLRACWRLVSSEHKHFYWLLLAICASKALELASPLVFKAMFDGAQAVINGATQSYTVWWYVALVFAIGIAGDVVTRLVRAPLFFVPVIRLEEQLPVRAHRKLLALSHGYHARHSIGKNSAKITKGCDKTIAIADRLAWGLIPSALYVLINVVLLAWFDARLALVFVVLAAPAVWLNIRSYERFNPQYLAWDKLKEKSNAYFFDIHRNGATVRDFVAEEYEALRFARVRQDMRELDLAVTWRLQAYLLGVGVCMHAAFVAVVVLSIYFAVEGSVTFGTAVFVAMTTNVTRQNLWEVVNNYTHIMRDIVSVERLAHLMNEKEDVQNRSAHCVPVGYRGGDIHFRNVTFQYGDSDTLIERLSMTITEGSMVALVGESGSGKTTIAKLLARVYDVSDGAIEFLGRDIRDWNRDSYRRLFATVSQTVEIFDVSIRENVTYGMRHVADDEVHEALRAAHLARVLEDTGRFPHGLETRVGENGVQLSGGERQRVGIARAYLALKQGARFLILDEATSALDSYAERVIQEFVETLRQSQGITIVAIAHRLSTIQRADEIVVLEQGRIHERGDHAQLLKQNGLYAQLVRLQQLGELRD